MPVKRDDPRPFRATGGPATIRAADPAAAGKSKLRRFSGRAYTGAPMKPEGWWVPIIVDLDGVKVPSQNRPMFRQHDPEQIVGHTDAVTVTTGPDGGIDVDGPLSGEPEHVRKVTHPADNGFKWQLSIGANPIRTEFLEAGETTEVNGRQVSGPMTISRETELGEISFVPLGADGETSATVSASQRKGNSPMFRAALKSLKQAGNVRAAKYADDAIDKMSEDEAKVALKKCMADDPPPDKDDPKAKARARAKARAEEDDKDKVDAEDDEDLDAEDDTDLEDKPTRAAAKRRILAARKAEGAEIRRCDAIHAAVKKAGVSQVEITTPAGEKRRVNLAAHAIENGWSADKAELEAMRAARPTTGPIVYSTSTPELNEAVLEAAVFQSVKCELFEDDFYTGRREERDRPIRPRDANRIKAELKERYPDQVQQAAHKLFKGRLGLQQLFTLIAGANGYRGRETISMDNLGEVAAYCMQQIRADGSSTISVQNVTANVQNKMMLQGYMYTEQSWKEIAGIRSVKDFKPSKSINLFGDVEFKDVPNSGELDNATLQDQAFANSAKTRGRMITIPRTLIINDDLGAFGQVPMLMGRGAGLKLNKVFWMKFMSPGYDDGGSTNFYAATHTITGASGNSNLSSGAGSALGSAGLTAATLLFDNQVDPMNYPLGLDAEVLLFPPDLQTTALELCNSEWIVAGGLASTAALTKQPSANIWKGRYRPVKSRYLNKTLVEGSTTVTGSTANWWLLANPSILPVIEVAFLNGQEMPTVQQAGVDFQFNVLGLSTRAFFDMDANSQNFRGGVKSAGS
jgi:hypothetical protein